jgi:hypothetical protein
MLASNCNPPDLCLTSSWDYTTILENYLTVSPKEILYILIYILYDQNSTPGTREKVRSRRINLEGNTHAQEINVSQLPV